MYYVYGLQLYVRNCIVHTAGTYTGARIMYLVYMKTSHVCGVPKNEKMRGNHTVGTEQDGLRAIPNDIKVTNHDMNFFSFSLKKSKSRFETFRRGSKYA